MTRLRLVCEVVTQTAELLDGTAGEVDAEGVLAMEHTQFFAHDARTAGIRNSGFVHAFIVMSLERF